MTIDNALKNVNSLAFDTAPLIYFIERNPTYITKMREIMGRIASQAVTGVASVLVMTEVLVQPIKTNNAILAQHYETILTRSQNFTLVAITLDITRKAAELRATYNLKTPDALHVATAIVSGADAFLTNDAGLKRVQDISVLILDELKI